MGTWLRIALVAAPLVACGSPAPAIVDAAIIGGARADAAVEDAPAIDATVDALAIDATGDAPAIDATVDALASDATGDALPPDDALPLADALPVDDALPLDDASMGLDAVPFAPGCADGTREGFTDPGAFPTVAACAGTWTGDIANAAPLCAPGWHVCDGTEFVAAGVTYAAATAFPGCYGFDAAHDNYQCLSDCSAQVAAGVDIAANLDLGGVGAGCRFQFPGTGSCLVGGRIDLSENTGTGCDYAPGFTSGAVCCAAVVVDTR